MDFDYSPKVQELQQRLAAFMDAHVYPNEQRFYDEVDAGDRWQPTRLIEELKTQARRPPACGISSCRSPSAAPASPTSSTRRCARSWAACIWAPEVFNCSAPDTGNMEVLERYGTRGAEAALARAAARGRDPLGLRDDRARTSPRRTRPTSRAAIVRDGDDYVINGRKWWTSGAGDPRCKILIFMGKTDPDGPTAPRSSR